MIKKQNKYNPSVKNCVAYRETVSIVVSEFVNRLVLPKLKCQKTDLKKYWTFRWKEKIEVVIKYNDSWNFESESEPRI